MPKAKVKAKFNEWRKSNHHILHKVHGVADCGYLFSALAEVHSVHVMAVSILLICGVIHIIVIGDFGE